MLAGRSSQRSRSCIAPRPSGLRSRRSRRLPLRVLLSFPVPATCAPPPGISYRTSVRIGVRQGLGFARDWALLRYRTRFVFIVRVRATLTVVSRNVGRRADLSGHWELDIPSSVLTRLFQSFHRRSAADACDSHCF